MCGFLVVASLVPGRPLPHERDELDRMRDTLEKRGPDAGETWIDTDRTIALGHRRLSVIDLAGARQPMASPDGRFHLVYNGEIYNFPELREELASTGYPFRTRGDTEVLLAAYLRWRESCVEHLNGIFAFAVWDADERKLFAARDHCGVKPLYYGVWNDTLYLASESKAIVADPRVERKVSPEALDLYFHHSYVPAPWAIWDGMRKLEAAHCVAFDLSGDAPVELPTPQRYWEVPFGRVEPSRYRREDLLEELDATLRTAVRRQTISDVPLGAFLSGGTDSSLIVAYLSEISNEPVRTFSVGFEEKEYDELRYARAVSQKYSTVHHELVMGTANLEMIDALVEPFDEPFCDPAGLPTAMVSALAREHVTVALSGDGGDETHAGYRRYMRQLQMGWVDRIPVALRERGLAPLASIAPSFKRRGALEQASRDMVDRYDAVMSTVPWDHRSNLYRRSFAERLRENGCSAAHSGAPDWWRKAAEELPAGASLLDRLQGLDLAAYLPEQLMTKTDRASMSVSLEVRVPFLDLDAIALAARIPPAMRLDSGGTKSLLRELLSRRMGADFAGRKKHGFKVPMTKWFRQFPRSRLEELLVPEGIEAWMDRGRVRSFLLDSRRGLEFAWPFAMFAAWQAKYDATA